MDITDTRHALHRSVFRGRPLPTAVLERWWASLFSCLSGKLRRLPAGGKQRLIVVPMETKAQVFKSQRGEPVARGELDLRIPGSLPTVLGTGREKKRRTIIRLPESLILRRRVALPAQVRSNLAQVLDYEIARLSPFRSDQVYFDFRILGDSAPGDKVGVDLAICLRAQVQEWLGYLREQGAPAEQILWEGAWPQANLLSAGERPRRGTRHARHECPPVAAGAGGGGLGHTHLAVVTHPGPTYETVGRARGAHPTGICGTHRP